jgi:serine/threonine protein kinase/tetratricopeptide (TPR) repeat protein
MTAPPSERPFTLDEIVQQAVSLDTDDRLPFLKRVCAHDKLLLEQALARLRHSSPEWWDQSIDSRTFDSFEVAHDRTGEPIGPYRIVRTLGQGGMGEVVLAERNDQQFRQQVAIKLVKRGVLSRNVQGRLKVERQILATLDHPNIARLLDGGATTDGTPYIVMEYIEGEAIDVYCDARRLSVEARLKLFRTVCSAVHSAHQNLIVHRDLKPSNILVTHDGIPKLLDFGIAKVLDDRKMMHTMAVTQMDVRVMTPEHASPEQIRGEPVTTASDIYTLGVLLYELLAGHKPYSIKSSRLSEIENAICEQEPLPLNTALPYRGESADTATLAICEARSTTVARLRRELSGDLANIVMTALRKEPERRYSSAEQFSADIERYLTDMPVAACKDSWPYRANKFVRRHRLAVSFSALTIVGLATFAIVTTIQSHRIASEQARAAQVSSFLIDMFQQADPTHSRGREVTVREMLDIGSRRIATQLAEQPDTRAHLQATVGKVYADLGLYDDAEFLLRESIAARTKLYGPRNPETAVSMQSLGDVLVRKKELVHAEPLLEDALAINRNAFGDHSVNLTASLRSLGDLRLEQQQPEAAEQLLRESLRILAASAMKANVVEKLAIDAETAATLNRLAIVLRQKGDYSAAEATYRRALTIAEKSLGRDHPTVAFITHNLAVVIERQGRLTEAQPLFKEAIELHRKVFGVEHPETLVAMANYGAFLHRVGEVEAAERILREVLTLRRKVFGDRHSLVGYDRVNLGLLLHDKGQFRDAETEFRGALDIYEESLPANHDYKGSAHRSLALTLVALGRNREAEQELNRSLEIFSAIFPKDNPQIISTRGALGQALAAQKRYAEAEPLLLDNYRLLLKTRGVDNPAVIRMRGWIEDLYRDWGKPDRARQFFAGLQTPSSDAK